VLYYLNTNGSSPFCSVKAWEQRELKGIEVIRTKDGKVQKNLIAKHVDVKVNVEKM
jgi:hypothetical protein